MKKIRKICVLILLGLFVSVGTVPMAAVAADSLEVEWIRQYGSLDSDSAYSVATDNSGNVYVVGYARDALPGQSHIGGSDAYIRNYDPAGTEKWTRQFGTDEDDFAFGVAADNSGNVYVVGRTDGEFLGGGGSNGGLDAFIRKYDPAGTEKWTRQFGQIQENDEVASDVAVDSFGNAYVVGRMDVEDPLLPEQDFDAFVLKYDPAGNQIASDVFGTLTFDDQAYGVDVDNSGNVFVAGATYGTLPGQSRIGLRDAYVRKYDSDLNEIRTVQFGTDQQAHDVALDVAADDSGNAYVTGNANRWMGGYYGDIFIRKFDPNLNEIQAVQFGTPTDDAAYGIEEHAGKVYISGYEKDDWSPIHVGDKADIFVGEYDSSLGEISTYRFDSSSQCSDYAYGIGVDDSGNVYAVGRACTFPGQPSGESRESFVIKFGQPSGKLCPLSQGFWKNHPDDWPLETLELGNETYDKTELLDILRTPVRGDASIILAHQLIAAKLNIAHGSDPDPISTEILDADALLGMFPGKLPFGVRPSTDIGKDMTAIAEVLDSYNNCKLTPFCVDNKTAKMEDAGSADIDGSSGGISCDSGLDEGTMIENEEPVNVVGSTEEISCDNRPDKETAIEDEEPVVDGSAGGIISNTGSDEEAPRDIGGEGFYTVFVGLFIAAAGATLVVWKQLRGT